MVRLGLVFVIFWLAFAASAAVDAPRKDDNCPRIAMLSAYVAQIGGFTRLDVCPTIVFSPTDPGTDGIMQDRAAARTIGSTYFPDSEVILLSATTDLDSVEGMARLVHELVHHYQYALGVNKLAPCRRALEITAFAVQVQFLRHNGLDTLADELERNSAFRGYCTTSATRLR